MNISQAVRALHPDINHVTAYRVEDHGDGPVLSWLHPTIPEPTAEELAQGWALHQAGAYRAERAKAYPPIGDQLDALGKGFAALADLGMDLPAETLAWLEHLATVKAAHPKP